MGAIAADVPYDRPVLHSELVLVCPELRKRALDLLPERQPYAFLARRTPTTAGDASQPQPAVARAVVAYAGLRALNTLRMGLSTAAALGALAMLAELAHWA